MSMLARSYTVPFQHRTDPLLSAGHLLSFGEREISFIVCMCLFLSLHISETLDHHKANFPASLHLCLLSG